MAARSTAGTRAAKPKTAAVVEETQADTENRPVIPKEIDVHQFIPVKSGFQGVLVYVSKRTGEEFIWNHFGDELDMELQELKNAKSTDKRFYESNWFMFDEPYAWVLNYLGVNSYYKNALSVDEFDDVFTMTPDQIRKTVAKLSDGQKASLGYRARQLMAEGGIDSYRAISALEESLGVQLTER